MATTKRNNGGKTASKTPKPETEIPNTTPPNDEQSTPPMPKAETPQESNQELTANTTGTTELTGQDGQIYPDHGNAMPEPATEGGNAGNQEPISQLVCARYVGPTHDWYKAQLIGQIVNGVLAGRGSSRDDLGNAQYRLRLVANAAAMADDIINISKIEAND